MKRKLLTIFCAAMITVLSIPSFASADTIVIDEDKRTKDFSDKWVLSTTVYEQGAKCVLTWGYNIILINEDYAYSYTVGNRHYSRIKNSRGTHTGPVKYANEWSDLEVRHGGSNPRYYQVWDN